MNLVTTISTTIDSLNRRIVKFLRFGKEDVQTSFEAMPYGFDSNPIKGMVAVYGPTAEKGKTVIIGYINKNQLAEVGELRLFSTDEDGDEKFYAWLRNDGTMEIGGNTHNAVRYTPLNTGLSTMVNQINAQLALIATGITGAGGVYTPGTISLDISAAKNDEIKTN